MKTKKIALLSSLLILALGGCAAHRDHHRQHAGPGMPGGPGTKHVLGPKTTCHGASCQVDVFVDANCSITAGDVEINSTTSVVNIVWRIQGGVFREDGIAIKNGPPGHFGKGSVQAQGAQFHHVFRNTAKDRWEFGLNVKVGSTSCPIYDPFIMN